VALFGGLDVRLDPWQVDYGSDPLAASSQENGSDQLITSEVELPAREWRPIAPQGAAPPRKLIFVDGVRRIEARVLARRAERLCHGAFGSYAVGCVAVENGSALCENIAVDRVLVLDSGETIPEPIQVGPGLAYRPISIAGEDPDAPLRRLQDEMRLAEERLSRELADREGVLVVSDGPLQFPEPVRGAAVGYIKRVLELYLPSPLLPVLFSLPAGARTPLFTLSSRRFARYSWFLRLAPPNRGESDLSGIVRLEVAEAVGVDTARSLANATALLLPRFAPSRGRDPRAPQNLLPIGALESHLRHRLGDPNIIRRRIGSEIAKETAHG
jgi:hypothetical protein